MKSSLRALIALPIVLFSMEMAAQCPAQADAGPDVHYCQGDPNPSLEGSISGDFLSFQWAPPAGLSSVTVLDPTVTITAPKTYTLTANGLLSNQILNGDFEGGNANFTTFYTYNPTTLWNEGTYTVTDNPNSVHPNFAACGDHTTGDGQMMVVNGSATAGVVVWGQVIPVQPNMTYRFSYWGCTVVASSPAQQLFRINGVNIGATFSFPAATCVWQQFFVIWNSGPATSANLQLINQNTAASGNDFAIDDINFQKQCSDVDTVQVFYHPDAFKTVNATICNGQSYQVGNEIFEESGNYLVNLQTSWGCDSLVQLNLNVINIDAEINPTDPIIDCQNPTVLLTSMGSVIPPGTQFSWTTAGGTIIGNPAAGQITAGGVGQYFLKLTYKNGQLTCIDTTSVGVQAASELPVAVGGPDKVIGCANPTATLSGSDPSGQNLTAIWASPNGHFVSGQNTFTPVVDAAGMYILTVTNPGNGCTDRDTVMVTQDLSVPVANAGPADTLDCQTSIVQLIGTASTGANFQFAWTTTNGHFASGQNTLTPTVDQPGQYFLTVSNTANGCTAISSVTIPIDTLKPGADAGQPFTLDCTTAFDTIFGSSPSSFQPVWTTATGHFVSGQNTLQPVVDEAGVYILKILNPVNHCESTTSVEIFKNTTPPVADAGPSFTLDCANPTATLAGSQTGGGANPSINWTTINGSFLSGQNSLSPVVGSAGTYILTIINPQNGCADTAFTAVVADPEIPTVHIWEPDTLDCLFDETTLVAWTSGGSNFSINWTTADGHIVSGETTLTPTIDKPGNYKITVVNPANGCSAINFIDVFENKVYPLIEINTPTIIDCNNVGSLLNGSNSSSGGQFSYTWTTANGQLLSGQNSAVAVAGKAGDYLFTVIDNENGCSSQKTVQVFADLNYPTADAGLDKTIGCLSPTVTLTAISSPNGANINILWTTSSGASINNPAANSITVSSPGVYLFTINNTQNGCSTADSVEVFEDNSKPVVVLPQPGQLTCSTTSVALLSTGSSFGNNFNYNWTTANGNFIGDLDTSFVEVDKVGQYVLTILNTQNGCTSSQSVTVTANVQPPAVDAGQPQVLDCQTTSLNLTGTAPAGATANWTTKNGHFLGGNSTFSPTIDAAGWYFLTATDPANGCTAIDSVQVLPDAGAPVLAVGVSGVLTCLNIQVQLNSTATSASGNSNNLQINWSTANGQFVSGQNTLNPVVSKAGNYLLTVKDLSNGCVSNSSINVQADLAVPIISLAAPDKITCANPTPTISASISTNGNDYNFQWSTTNGQFYSGTNSLAPKVSKIGSYTLTATDLSSGCTANQSISVTESLNAPSIVFNQPEVLTCSKTSITINASNSTGSVVDWKKLGSGPIAGQTALQLPVNAPGLYVLTTQFLTNGCTTTDTIEVLQNTTAPIVSINKPDTISCKKSSVQLTATGVGQGVLSFAWATTNGQISGPSNQPIITANKTGLYRTTVTDAANGCTATAQAQVLEDKIPPALLIPQPPKLSCKDSTVTLATVNSAIGKPYSWAWAGSFLSLADTLKPVVNQVGQYSLTITDNKNGCKSTQSVNVLGDFAPPPADAGPPTVLTCADPTGSIGTAGPGSPYQFFWTTSDGHISGSPAAGTSEADKPGTYFLTVTDPKNGCTATDFVTFSENKLTGAAFDAISPTCSGQRGKILLKNMAGGTLPYRFSADGGQNWQDGPAFDNLEPGSYPLAVEDAGGCRIDLAAYISPGSTIVIDLEKEAEISLGGSWLLAAKVNVPLARLDTIQWSPAATLDCADCLKTTASPLETTTYRLFVADTAGCSAEAFFLLKVSRPPVFAPNVLKNDGAFLENDHFTLFTDAAAALKIKKLMVFDRWGNVLFERADFPPNQPALGWGANFRGKSMGNGVYVWWAEIEWIDGKTSFMKGDITVWE